MGTTRDDKSLAWKLMWSADYSEEDLEIEDSSEGQRSHGLSFTRIFDLPDPVTFYALSDSVSYTDYPYNNIRWPIMSRHMLRVLLAVGEFDHRLYSIQVVRDGDVLGSVDFVGVQILAHQDYFDWERSNYRPGRSPGLVRSVSEFALNVPEGGFPPLFRLSASPTDLFISDKARQALREAGIRGTAYLPLDRFEAQVDLPMIVPAQN